jgi:hypothetical protein
MSDAELSQDEQQYLREVSVDALLANHAFVLLQLGAMRLAETPPRLDDAQLLIDNLDALLGVTGDRLGEHAGLYRDAVSELKSAFARASTTD